MNPDADPRPQYRSPVHDADVRQGGQESPYMDRMDYLDYIAYGAQAGPVLTAGALGPAFLTWRQRDFRDMRRRFGEGDPDRGNYNLNQIHFNKENGALSVQTLDVGPSSWYGSPPDSYDPTRSPNA